MTTNPVFKKEMGFSFFPSFPRSGVGTMGNDLKGIMEKLF